MCVFGLRYPTGFGLGYPTGFGLGYPTGFGLKYPTRRKRRIIFGLPGSTIFFPMISYSVGF